LLVFMDDLICFAGPGTPPDEGFDNRVRPRFRKKSLNEN